MSLVKDRFAWRKTRFITVSTIAAKTGMSPKTVRRLLETGALGGAIRTPGGHWRIPASSFEGWLARAHLPKARS